MHKVGVYVDVSNVNMNEGFAMRYDVLRAFAEHGGLDRATRLNAYATYNRERAEEDPEYKQRKQGWYALLRGMGFKVIVKNYQWRVDDEGQRIPKANVDIDLTVDALTQSAALDRVLLVTGDGDFAPLARALQSKGVRVEGLAFGGVSQHLVRELDQFTWGQTVPDLVDIRPHANVRERYYCGEVNNYNPDKKFGFIRYRENLEEAFPSKSVFFHINKVADPSQEFSATIEKKPSSLVRFKLIPADAQDHDYQAADVSIVYPKGA